MKIRLLMVIVIAVSAFQGWAQQKPQEATPQRPSFTTDTNITEVGTVELEFGFEGNHGYFGFPTTWKFTPAPIKAEISVSYNSLMSAFDGHSRITQFTDRVTVAVRKPFWSKGPLAFAATGLVTKFSRNEHGLRAGGTLHANWSGKWLGLVVNETYTYATKPSPANLEHLWDTAATLSFNPPVRTRLSRFAPFVSVLNERGNNRLSTVSTMYGSYFKIRPDWYLDGSVRQVNITGGVRDQQLVFGFVKNFGQPKEWF